MSRSALLSSSTARFGTFAGVFTPNVLTILGIILFLRAGWVVGQAGLPPDLGRRAQRAVVQPGPPRPDAP